MARFTFPPMCCRCAETGPDREWSLCRRERAGNWETTYAIGVPVCAGCVSALRARRVATWSAALILALAAVSAGTAAGLSLFVASVVGFLAGGFAGLFLGWLIGLSFARIGRGGRRLHFANRRYQATFDRLNVGQLTY